MSQNSLKIVKQFFFVLNHPSAMLIKILRKCTHRLSWEKSQTQRTIEIWKAFKSSVIYSALSEHGQFLKELGKNMISPIRWFIGKNKDFFFTSISQLITGGCCQLLIDNVDDAAGSIYKMLVWNINPTRFNL